MDYQSFKMKLVELVQKEISESVEISLERIPKNNGIYSADEDRTHRR